MARVKRPDGKRHGQRDDADGAAAAGQEEGDEGKPQDARGVRREGDVACLVEATRALARLESVHRAAAHQDEWIHQSHQVRVRLHPLAYQNPAVSKHLQEHHRVIDWSIDYIRLVVSCNWQTRGADMIQLEMSRSVGIGDDRMWKQHKSRLIQFSFHVHPNRICFLHLKKCTCTFLEGTIERRMLAENCDGYFHRHQKRFA